MADYFTHFSCLLDVGTPDNAARALDLYNKLSEDGTSEKPPSEGFLLSIQPEHCQSAYKFDPVSASNFDPFARRDLRVALDSSELAGIAETRRARAA